MEASERHETSALDELDAAASAPRPSLWSRHEAGGEEAAVGPRPDKVASPKLDELLSRLASAAAAHHAPAAAAPQPPPCAKCGSGIRCTTVAHSCGQLGRAATAGDADAAIAVATSLVARGHRMSFPLWTRLIAALGAGKRPAAAESVLRRMADCGFPPDVFAYNTVITSWCSVGAVDEAERCLQSMVQAGLKPNESTYPELIRLLATRGRVRDAEAYVARLETEGLLPEEKYFNALVRGAVAAGRLEDAEAVLQKMHNDVLNLELVSRRGGSLPPSAITYGVVMNAYAANGDVRSVRRLLDTMRWRSVPPSTAIFNMLIKAFCAAGKPEAADGVLREMAGSGSWDMDALGISPNAISFTSVAAGYAEAGLPDRVRGLMSRMAFYKLQPDEVTWSTLITAYRTANQPEEAEAVLAEMTAAGVAPGVVSWTSVIAAWARAGDAPRAAATLRRMRSARVAPNERAWHHVIRAYGEASDLLAAATAVRGMAAQRGPRAPPSVRTRRILESAFTGAGLSKELAGKAWAKALAAAAADVATAATAPGAKERTLERMYHAAALPAPPKPGAARRQLDEAAEEARAAAAVRRQSRAAATAAAREEAAQTPQAEADARAEARRPLLRRAVPRGDAPPTAARAASAAVRRTLRVAQPATLRRAVILPRMAACL